MYYYYIPGDTYEDKFYEVKTNRCQQARIPALLFTAQRNRKL